MRDQYKIINPKKDSLLEEIISDKYFSKNILYEKKYIGGIYSQLKGPSKPGRSFNPELADIVNSSFGHLMKNGVMIFNGECSDLGKSIPLITPGEQRGAPLIPAIDHPKPKKRHNPEITEEDRKQFEAQQNANNQGQNTTA